MGILCLVPLAFLLAQWEKPFELARINDPESRSAPSISASYGGVVHIVWSDRRDKNFQVFYRRSEDGGLTWESAIPLTGKGSNAEDPQVSIAGVMNPVTHVVWVDDRDGNKEIYYKRTADWGVTWSDDVRLTGTDSASYQPDLRGCICCGTDVRVMWVDEINGNPDIFYKISTDNGVSWSDDIQITHNKAPQSDPSFAFCGSAVQAVWVDCRNGQAEVWGRRSTDSGLAWSEEECLAGTANGSATFPAIAHAPDPNDSMLQLFWLSPVNAADNTRSFDVFYQASPDLGLSWKPPVRLTEYSLADSAARPACAALGSVLYMAIKNPNGGILYRSSFDRGGNWHEDSSAVRLSCSVISGPSIALAGKILHAAWLDDHTGRPALYYTRNPNGNPVPFE